jgi:aconitate hydratase
VGYGCTTCIGNSGPLPDEVSKAIKQGSLVASAVISGNRNFEGRVHPQVKANYLASPPLVVAYAIAGTVDRDLTTEPLGTGTRRQARLPEGRLAERRRRRAGGPPCIKPAMYQEHLQDRLRRHRGVEVDPDATGELYAWDDESTYIQEPPFFRPHALRCRPQAHPGARVLASSATR